MQLGRRPTLTQCLADLAPLARGDREVRLRVGLNDGSVVDGVLESASRKQLSLRLTGAESRQVPAVQIHSVYLAVSRSGWVMLALGALILVTIASALGLVSVTWLRIDLLRIATAVAVLGFVAVSFLQRHTRVGAWLTSWRTLFDARDHAHP